MKPIHTSAISVIETLNLPDVGLAILSAEQGNELKNNYRQLPDLLRQNLPENSDSLPAESTAQAFEVQGYYIGKKLLKAMLDHDFKDYDGIRLSFGLSDTPANEGTLVLLVQGAHQTKGEDDIVNFAVESDEILATCVPPGGPAPVTVIVQNPPYGK